MVLKFPEPGTLQSLTFNEHGCNPYIYNRKFENVNKTGKLEEE